MSVYWDFQYISNEFQQSVDSADLGTEHTPRHPKNPQFRQNEWQKLYTSEDIRVIYGEIYNYLNTTVTSTSSLRPYMHKG